MQYCALGDWTSEQLFCGIQIHTLLFTIVPSWLFLITWVQKGKLLKVLDETEQ